MKKLIALTIAVLLMMPSAFAATDFTDLKSDHWAYTVVNTLVDEGTIKGYEDGSFRPDNTVTRAEFAKMTGKGIYEINPDEFTYSDVPSTHWAYEYIMTSEIASATDTTFEPDTPITRGDAIAALWERNGSVMVNDMPDFIKAQGSAASWAYSYGIMTGDDGMNLRLTDTITRAEAAALIVRAKNSKVNKGFSASLPNSVCETVYNSTRAFTSAYNENATMTYGEFATAVVLITNNTATQDYADFYALKPYESEHARDMFVLCFYALDKEFATLENELKPITIGDAKKGLLKMVSTIRAKKQADYELYLTPDASDSKPATHRDIAAMLLQVDEKVGLETYYTTQKDANDKYTKKTIKTEKSNIPANAENYKAILSGIPASVYAADLSGAKELPRDTFSFAQDFSPFFLLQCDKIVKAAKEQYGIDITVSFYPAVCYDNGKSFTMTIKVTVDNLNGKSYTASDLFKSGIVNDPGTLSNGTEFFVTLSTGSYAINQ